MTAAPSSRCWHYPLQFAIWRTICTHILVVPLTTMCRSNKVSKYQLIIFWIKITHHRLCWCRHHDGLGATDFTVHLPLSPQLTSGASLIHRRQRAATIWRWDVVFTNMFSLLILSHLVKFDSSVRCATHHTSHTNLNPIHHPGAQITSLKYIFPTKGCSGKRWDMTCNLFICNFLAILLICTLLVKHDNKTIHNNQTPRNNQSLDQLLKDQQRKKVSNGLLKICLLPYIFVHSPSLCCF